MTSTQTAPQLIGQAFSVIGALKGLGVLWLPQNGQFISVRPGSRAYRDELMGDPVFP